MLEQREHRTWQLKLGTAVDKNLRGIYGDYGYPLIG